MQQMSQTVSLFQLQIVAKLFQNALIKDINSSQKNIYWRCLSRDNKISTIENIGKQPRSQRAYNPKILKAEKFKAKNLKNDSRKYLVTAD